MTSPGWMVNFLKAVKEGRNFCDRERTQDSCPGNSLAFFFYKTVTCQGEERNQQVVGFSLHLAFMMHGHMNVKKSVTCVSVECSNLLFI
jgi:hypothetical protein